MNKTIADEVLGREIVRSTPGKSVFTPSYHFSLAKEIKRINQKLTAHKNVTTVSTDDRTCDIWFLVSPKPLVLYPYI